MQVSQGGRDSPPDVLVRFREIVGEGNITGPYRDNLYYWKTTRKDRIDEVARMLWPYLSSEKKAQYAAMTRLAGRGLPFSVDTVIRDQRTERAWAAGLFDGEGSIWVCANRRWPAWRGLAMDLPQSSATGVPETLTRFHRVVGAGAIGGPRTSRNPWSKLPQYRWQLNGRHLVSRVVGLLLPYMAKVNRSRMFELRELLDAEVAADLAPS